MISLSPDFTVSVKDLLVLQEKFSSLSREWAAKECPDLESARFARFWADYHRDQALAIFTVLKMLEKYNGSKNNPDF